MINVITIAQISGKRKQIPDISRNRTRPADLNAKINLMTLDEKLSVKNTGSFKDYARQRDYLLTRMDEKGVARKQKNAVTHHCQQGVLFRV